MMNTIRQLELRSMVDYEGSPNPVAANNVDFPTVYDKFFVETLRRLSGWSALELDYYAREAEDLIKSNPDILNIDPLFVQRQQQFAREADKRYAASAGYILVENDIEK